MGPASILNRFELPLKNRAAASTIRLLPAIALAITFMAAPLTPAFAAIDPSTVSSASATTTALASPSAPAATASATSTPVAATSTPAPTGTAQQCDPNVETSLNQISQGNQEYMSQVTKQLLPPPPSVAQLSCFDYQVKLMANNVLSRFTSSGAAGLGGILTGGPINDVLGVPFQSFITGNYTGGTGVSWNPISAMSSITNSLTSTITSALTSSISTAIGGLGAAPNPALCNVMSKLWDLVQCSGFLDNLPQLPSLDLGSSLMPNSCAGKVLFNAALGAMRGSSFSDTTSFSGNSTFVTKIETGYK